MLYTNRSVDQLYQRNLLAAQRRLARPQPPPPTPPQEHRTSHRHPGRERVPNRQGENGSSPPQKGLPAATPPAYADTNVEMMASVSHSRGAHQDNGAAEPLSRLPPRR